MEKALTGRPNLNIQAESIQAVNETSWGRGLRPLFPMEFRYRFVIPAAFKPESR